MVDAAHVAVRELEDESPATRLVYAFLLEDSPQTINELAEAFDHSYQAIHELVSNLEAAGWVESSIRRTGTRGRDPNVYTAKTPDYLDGVGTTEEYWCGLCGFGPRRSTNSILIHHGNQHGSPNLSVVRAAPWEPVAVDGYWCGRCGDGPFEESVDVDDHHEDLHGRGDAIVLDSEPDEDDLAGEVEKPGAVNSWSGRTATDGGRSR